MKYHVELGLQYKGRVEIKKVIWILVRKWTVGWTTLFISEEHEDRKEKEENEKTMLFGYRERHLIFPAFLLPSLGLGLGLET